MDEALPINLMDVCSFAFARRPPSYVPLLWGRPLNFLFYPSALSHPGNQVFSFPYGSVSFLRQFGWD